MNGISRPGMSASFLNQLTTLLKKGEDTFNEALEKLLYRADCAFNEGKKYYRKAPYLIYDYEIVFVEHVF